MADAVDRCSDAGLYELFYTYDFCVFPALVYALFKIRSHDLPDNGIDPRQAGRPRIMY